MVRTGKEVVRVPTETLIPKEPGRSDRAPEPVLKEADEVARKLALRHRQNVRRFKLWLVVYLTSMLALTPVWIVTQYETAGGWPTHLSSRSRNPGDWDPWIIWVALIGAVLVVMAGLRAYADHDGSEDGIERKIDERKSSR